MDADVTPLMKVKPVTTIAKHVWPITLTPALSKLAEDFVVSKYIGSAVLETIDSKAQGKRRILVDFNSSNLFILK